MGIYGTTAKSEEADALAEDREFRRAATLRAQSAHDRLVRFGIEETTNANLAIGDLLYAIYYARRADDDRAAERLRNTLESYAYLLRDAAEERRRERWPRTDLYCLGGSFEEWIGDACLMIGSPEAYRYYERAEAQYEKERERERAEYGEVDEPGPCWAWGLEPEWDETNFAFRDFLRWRDANERDEFHPPEYALDFFRRVADKRDLADRLVE